MKIGLLKKFTPVAPKVCEACLTSISNTGKTFWTHYDQLCCINCSKGTKHCLVTVDMWSKWVEAFPTAKQDACAMSKAQTSSRDAEFHHKFLVTVAHFMQMTPTNRHPKTSGGAVEQENETIKTQILQQMGLTRPYHLASNDVVAYRWRWAGQPEPEPL